MFHTEFYQFEYIKFLSLTISLVIFRTAASVPESRLSLATSKSAGALFLKTTILVTPHADNTNKSSPKQAVKESTNCKESTYCSRVRS